MIREARALLFSTVSKHTDTSRHERLEKAAMQPLTQDVMRIIGQKPGCLLDEITLACPEMTWNQVFLEIDHLSRNGQVQLTLEGPGRYRVWCVGRVAHQRETHPHTLSQVGEMQLC